MRAMILLVLVAGWTAAAEARKPVAIGFDWGAPCRVPARQRVEVGGRSVEVSFEVALVKAGKGFELRLENPRVIAGEPTAEANPQLAVWRVGVVPVVRLSSRGKLLGVSAENLPASVDVSPDLLPRRRYWPVLIEGLGEHFWQHSTGGWLGRRSESNGDRPTTMERTETLDPDGDRLDLRIEAKLDVKRGRPHWLRVEARRGDQRELQETVLDWSSAKGCR